MNAEQLTDNDEPLSALLSQWKVTVSLPPRFEEQVWRRIARTSAEIEPSLGQILIHWVETTFRRPALATAYVAVLLAMGLTTGYLQAHGKSAQAESKWRALYVQSIDPYQAPRD